MIRQFAIGWLLSLGLAASASDVYVRADEEGRGVLRKRGDDCFVVTPQHVLGKASAVRVTDRVGRTLQANLARKFAPDIAILKLTDASFCVQQEWPIGEDIDTLLANPQSAVLTLRQASGGTLRVPVFVAEYEPIQYIRIRAALNEQPLQKGMSGGVLTVNGRRVGMLMEVDGTLGLGLAFRWNYLSNAVEDFFTRIDPSSAISVGRSWYVISSTPVFSGADASATKVGAAPAGHAVLVEVLNADRSWARIQAEGNVQGYVPASSLSETAPWPIIPWKKLGDVGATVGGDYASREGALADALNRAVVGGDRYWQFDWSSPAGLFSSARRGTITVRHTYEVRGRWCRDLYESERGSTAKVTWHCRREDGSWEEMSRDPTLR